MSATLRLADLDPRIRKMVSLILSHRAEIGQPYRGIVEMQFTGPHVELVLVSKRRLTLDDDKGPPPEAA